MHQRQIVLLVHFCNAACAGGHIEMQEREWELLFLVALSHGEQLASRQLRRYWLMKFIESLGFTPDKAYRTGVTALYCELLWNRKSHLPRPGAQITESLPSNTVTRSPRTGKRGGDGSMFDSMAPTTPRSSSPPHQSQAHAPPTQPDDSIRTYTPATLEASNDAACNAETVSEVCTAVEFTTIMMHLCVRCYQSHRAQELLHRFNEKVAITATAAETISFSDAIAFASRKYLAKAFEQSLVTTDSVLTINISRCDKSTLSPVAKQMIEHIFAATMDTILIPLFVRFGKYGLLTVEQFIAFAEYAFTGKTAPHLPFVRAIFCQANALDTVSMVANSGDKAPELEMDEFLDAVLLLGVLMFSDESQHPALRTVESKVWAFMEHLAALLGVPMCATPYRDSDVCTFEPRLSLVHPAVLPVYMFTAFVVGGVQLSGYKKAHFNHFSGTGSADPSVTPMHSAMLQARSKTNRIAEMSARLLTDNFDQMVTDVYAVLVPTKPLAARKSPVAMTPHAVVLSSSFRTSAATSPISGNEERMAPIEGPLDDFVTSSLHGQPVAALSPAVQSVDEQPAPAAGSSASVLFHVDGCEVAKPQPIGPNRVKLQLPQGVLHAARYKCFATFQLKVLSSAEGEESEVVVATVHRESVAEVSISSLHRPSGEEGCSVEQHNAVPLILRLKPVETTMNSILCAALEELFDSCAPTGRMDLAQFTNSTRQMKNIPRDGDDTHREEAFAMFASTSSGSIRARLTPQRTVAVTRSKGAALHGPPRLSFVDFLHALGWLYLSHHGAKDKLPNILRFFELAFDEAKLTSIAEQQGSGIQRERAVRCSNRCPPPTELPKIVDAYGVLDNGVEVPFQRAVHQRHHHRQENQQYEQSSRQQFWKRFKGVPPKPSFPVGEASETPLTAVLREGAANSLDFRSTSNGSDAQLSFGARAGSMRNEYLAAAMVRTRKL